MEIEVKQVEGLNFLGKGDSSHWVAIDGPEEHGGTDAASNPLELCLIGPGAVQEWISLPFLTRCKWILKILE